mgnify:CR=1 FL=1
MKNVIDENDELVDKTIEELYKYNIYSNDEVKSKLIGNYEKINDFQDKALKLFESEITDISQSFLQTEQMNKDQKKVNTLMENQYELLKERNKNINRINNHAQKKHDIYAYYYYKYRKQLEILYILLLFIIFLLLISIIDRYYPMKIVYSIIVGLSTAIFFIYTGERIYDIYLRSEIVFDEYEFSKPKKKKQKNEEEKNKEDKTTISDNNLNDDCKREIASLYR